MILKGKYIIIVRHDLELPILFDEMIDHYSFKHLDPIRAGFFEMEPVNTGVMTSSLEIDCCTFGNSSSLKLESDSKDQELIIRNFYKL